LMPIVDRETVFVVKIWHTPRAVFLIKDRLQDACAGIIGQHASLVNPIDAHIEKLGLHDANLLVTNADTVHFFLIGIRLADLVKLIEIFTVYFRRENLLDNFEAHIDIPISNLTRVLNCLRR